MSFLRNGSSCPLSIDRNEIGFEWSGRRQTGGLEPAPASGEAAAVKGEKVLEVAQAAAEHAREQEMRGAEV